MPRAAGQIIASSDIQVGTASVTFTTQTGFTQTVTFPGAFATTPKVMANIDAAPASVSGWKVQAINITTTTFQIFASGPSASWTAVPVGWIAIAT